MGKPADGKYTRGDDPKNTALPPSVRMMNYAKAAVTAWPIVVGLIGLLGYTNADHIKSAFTKPLEHVEDAPAEIVSGGLEEQMNAAIRNINEQLKTLKARDARLSQQVGQISESLEQADTVNTQDLQKQIDAIKRLVQ